MKNYKDEKSIHSRRLKTIENINDRYYYLINGCIDVFFTSLLNSTMSKTFDKVK